MLEVVLTEDGLEEQNYVEPLNQVVRDFKYSSSSRRFKIMHFEKVMVLYNIIQVLKDNFGPGVRKYPLLALCYNMGNFENPQVASETTMEEPYRWGAYNTHDDHWANIVNNDLQPDVTQHAMLITGLCWKFVKIAIFTNIGNSFFPNFVLEINIRN
ncbi:hypothetical protein Hanom_Chr01g00086951 [Helianthus anomalus]